MNVFLLVGGLLLLGILVALLYPHVRRPSLENEDATGQRELNMNVLRGQLRDLEKEFKDARIPESEYRKSREKIERRALDYDGKASKTEVAGGRKIVLAMFLAIGLPVAVGSLYWLFGKQETVVPGKTAGVAKDGEHALSQQQITAMVERLALRLQDNPKDGAGWLMLARSYAVLGRYSESSAAFSNAVKILPPDAQHYADYADVVAMAHGKSLSGEPEKLVRRALEIDAKNVKALALSATIAFERQDYAQAIREWQKVSVLLPEGSPLTSGIQASISDAQNRMAITGKQMPESPQVSSKKPAVAPKLSGVVELDPKLHNSWKPGDTLFVFARAVNGPKMPVAMLRAKASDLPMVFNLDDSMAMTPQFKLSSVGPVVVGARISKSGDALAKRGDLEGLSGPVTVGIGNVKIVINSVVQ